MADAYREKFDKVTELVPPATKLIQHNNITGTEVWAEVPSGTPIVVKPPIPADKDPKFYEKSSDRAAAIAKLNGGGMSTNPKFKALTGYEHQTLLNHWGTHDIGSLTSCNAFVGRTCAAFDCGFLGSFGLEEVLAKMGRSDCWVQAKADELPRYGDVFESRSGNVGFQNLHIGFSLDFADGKWNTLEGGQGGPSLGYDRVCRLKKTYTTTHMLGWVDMRKLTGYEISLPSWFLGTWMIVIDGRSFIYQADRSGTVVELGSPPPTSSTDLPAIDSATVLLATGTTIKLQWKSGGAVETLTFDPASNASLVKRVTGTAGKGGALSGLKLF